MPALVDDWLCLGEQDGEAEIAWSKEVILNTKFFENPEGKPWKNSVKDLNLGVLLVSQFTLYAQLYKKGRLDFHHALAPEPARELYNGVVAAIEREIGSQNTQVGQFGAMMEVNIVNDGPVTITLDSNDKIR